MRRLYSYAAIQINQFLLFDVLIASFYISYFYVSLNAWVSEMKKKGFVCNNAKKDPTAATDNMKQLELLNKVLPLTKLELARFWGFLYSATVLSAEGTRLSFSSWCLTNWLLFSI